eukprot:TRINITY_DN13477_c1_g1_i2.p1 TRINITY_DN13477_c1_g1~~TRINITY_DN13477_c1_g1_i2.p1  ORF type:complete len:195 (+),score=23.95 TRINITY_DN13477_c1_g1_i2:94-678(+)
MEVELSKLIVPPSSSQCLFPIGQLFAETNGTTLQNALQRDFPMVQLFAETKGTTGKRSKKMYPEKDIFAQGTFCQIRKHARIGCAIVHFVAKDLQAAVLKVFGIRSIGESAVRTIGGHEVMLRHHIDESTCKVDSFAIFIFWGHRAETRAPISVRALANHVDLFAKEIMAMKGVGVQPPRADQVPLPRFSMVSS